MDSEKPAKPTPARPRRAPRKPRPGMNSDKVAFLNRVKQINAEAKAERDKT